MDFSLVQLLFKNIKLSQWYVDKEMYILTMHKLADFTLPQDQEKLH